LKLNVVLILEEAAVDAVTASDEAGEEVATVDAEEVATVDAEEVVAMEAEVAMVADVEAEVAMEADVEVEAAMEADVEVEAAMEAEVAIAHEEVQAKAVDHLRTAQEVRQVVGMETDTEEAMMMAGEQIRC
jgi:hypothetical protein